MGYPKAEDQYDYPVSVNLMRMHVNIFTSYVCDSIITVAACRLALMVCCISLVVTKVSFAVFSYSVSLSLIHLFVASNPNGGYTNKAQVASSDSGCIIRIRKDGTIPPGNLARAW